MISRRYTMKSSESYPPHFKGRPAARSSGKILSFPGRNNARNPSPTKNKCGGTARNERAFIGRRSPSFLRCKNGRPPGRGASLSARDRSTPPIAPRVKAQQRNRQSRHQDIRTAQAHAAATTPGALRASRVIEGRWIGYPECFERPDAALLSRRNVSAKPNVAKHGLDVVRSREPEVPDGQREEAIYVRDVLFDGRDPQRMIVAGLSPDALDGLCVVLASIAVPGSDFLQCTHPAEQIPPLERVQGTAAEHLHEQPDVALYVSAMVLQQQLVADLWVLQEPEHR